jgi:NAD-dependent oxidoreductase involved in siderophore biosynthesis
MNHRSHPSSSEVRSPEQQLQQQIEVWQALLEKLGENEMSDRISSSCHPAKRDRIQQLQQQIEVWQAIRLKLGC